MGKRIIDFFHSDLGVLVFIAALRFTIHVATNGQYGFHRDELQTLDDARHPDWGFVAYPPITPVWAVWSQFSSVPRLLVFASFPPLQ